VTGSAPDRAPERDRVLVSAHRAGWGGDPTRENTREALAEVAVSGVDYVELDVRRLADGALVLGHEPWVCVDGHHLPLARLTAGELRTAEPSVLLLEDGLDLLAGRVGAHLDLKLSGAGPEEVRRAAVTAATLAVARLGPAGVLVTTGRIAAARAAGDWARTEGLDVPVALSVGGSVAGHPWGTRLRLRHEQLFPGRRLERSGADVLAANHWLALLGLARQARRARLPLLVWTVDHPRLLRHWLRPGRAWMVTTNRPDLAMSIRDAMIWP
jgi:glycerophosphoryl diester phosphodiesterase